MSIPRRIYVDHGATTPTDPRVVEAMLPFFTEQFGNASSIHQFGQKARAAVDRSRGVDLTYLPVDRDGRVDPDDVRAALRPDTVLISVMHANNEIGTLEPVAEIGRLAREREILMHTDATQSVGLLSVQVDALSVDLLSMSAHKRYGPKGVGALYVRKGSNVARIQHGGSHERNRRAGTENVPAIVGFGVAIRIATEWMYDE